MPVPPPGAFVGRPAPRWSRASPSAPARPRALSPAHLDEVRTRHPRGSYAAVVEDPGARSANSLNKKSVVAWLPVVAWAGLIFAFSAQTNLRFVPDEGLDFVIRKLGHMAVFGILALLLWRAFARTTTLRRPWAWALASTVLYAMSDEFHQSFVAGRNASMRDVAIDAAGALIAVAIVAVVGAPRFRGRPSS